MLFFAEFLGTSEGESAIESIFQCFTVNVVMALENKLLFLQKFPSSVGVFTRAEGHQCCTLTTRWWWDSKLFTKGAAGHQSGPLTTRSWCDSELNMGCFRTPFLSRVNPTQQSAWRAAELKGTQDWEFFWLRFWNLRYFFVSYVKILRFYKKKFLIGPLLGEVRFFHVVLGLRGMRKNFELGPKNILLLLQFWTLNMTQY